ncbi:MAG: hypothetical protein WA944_07415 [Mycobacterium sp.]
MTESRRYFAEICSAHCREEPPGIWLDKLQVIALSVEARRRLPKGNGHRYTRNSGPRFGIRPAEFSGR